MHTESQLRVPNVCTLVLAVLKKNYARLYYCLPDDYVKTVDKMRQFISGAPENYLDNLRTLPTTELINEAITGQVMRAVREDKDALWFCDVMERFCDSITSKQYIESTRNGMKVCIIH